MSVGKEKTFREMMNIELYRLLIEIDVSLSVIIVNFCYIFDSNDRRIHHVTSNKL
jgi:hypothetical protein